MLEKLDSSKDISKDFRNEIDLTKIEKNIDKFIETNNLKHLNDNESKIDIKTKQNVDNNFSHKTIEHVIENTLYKNLNDPLELDAVKDGIEKYSEYSKEINKNIKTVDELNVYKNENLEEKSINERKCLTIKNENIDPNYKCSDGLTNKERMELGKPPIDHKTGEIIELHHIGQKYDGPFAELTESIHDDYYSTLHENNRDSWRNDIDKKNEYNNIQRPKHWQSRAKEF